MIKFLLAAGLTVAYIGSASAQTNLHEKCTRDRCVYYRPSGERVLSVTKRGSTYEARGWPQQDRIAILERNNGSTRVEKPRR
jgi:hypothetical protein